MSELKIAVIGVGHLGRIHARLLGQVAGARLVAVVDPSAETRTAVAAVHNVAAHADHRPLIGQIDAAIIAAPSRLHYSVASDLLAAGVHVFVEKPITVSVADATDLIDQAADRRLVLQVGHVERFNAAFATAQAHVHEPKYIAATRTSPFTGRSIDIGAVLDLMIHDIDLVLALSGDDISSVEALGGTFVSNNEDWAQARLTFKHGCVANLYACRAAGEPRRTVEVVCQDAMAHIDLGQHELRLIRGQQPPVEIPVEPNNALLDEQRNFVAAIQGEAPVRVDGPQGRRALDVAERILAKIAAHRWDGSAAGRIGPHFEERVRKAA
jgi:predicted dehydrogenase